MAFLLSMALFVSVFLFISELHGPLQAYLDPGTGSIVFQALIAGVVGVISIAKLYWHKMRSYVRRGGDSHGK